MAKFRVEIREVHVAQVDVEASTEAEAIEKSKGINASSIEYSHTLDPETWTVEKIVEFPTTGPKGDGE